MEQAEIEQLGVSLRRIDRKLISHPAEGERIRVWYQGGEPYFDLFVELREQQIEWFQLTLRGRSLSWQQQRDGSADLAVRDGETGQSLWQTGVTNELQANDLHFYAASKTIQSDRQVNQTFLELAHAILKTRAGETLFDCILTLFKQRED